jgi:hypothetical protein
MTTKHEITRKFALAYAGASKRDKSRLLDEVCAITSWSRDNARRQLRAARETTSGGEENPRNSGPKILLCLGTALSESVDLLQGVMPHSSDNMLMLFCDFKICSLTTFDWHTQYFE